MNPRHVLALLALSIVIFAARPGQTKQVDRQEPMDIASDHIAASMDGDGSTVLTGNVVVDQGSLQVQAEAGTLKTTDGDITHIHFTGTPVKLNQELDDGTPVDAVSREVQYDLATDTITFIGEVVLKKPTDTLHGERVVYNMRTGKMRADANGGNSRVRMHVLPRAQRAVGDGSAKPASTD